MLQSQIICTKLCKTENSIVLLYFIAFKPFFQHRFKHDRCRNKYVSSLKSLHAAGVGLQQTEGMPYYEVPLELLQHLDEGGNPDTFVVDTIKSTLRSSEDAKRIVGQLKSLRSNVEGALSK